MRSLAAAMVESSRQARWLRVVIAGVRRRWRVLRVIGAALAALGLLSVAIFVDEAPVGAQEAESTGVGISLDDLSSYPTHLTVDGFMVELSNLTATESYQVVVSSDSARVGIGGCGTRSQTQSVTGVAAQELRFLVYACAVGEATVTAEMRRTGASSPEASVSQRLVVEALPEIVIGPSGERIRTTTTRGTQRAVPKAGTPGIVPLDPRDDTDPDNDNLDFEIFDQITSTSVRVNWLKPSDGGTPLTGYGLLFWPGTVDQQPAYSTALVKAPSPTPRQHTYTGLQPGTTYNFRVHACNGVDSCGYWTNPPKQVTTLAEVPVGRPAQPHTIKVVNPGGGTSLKVSWSADANTGGRPLTRFQAQRREVPGSYPLTPQANRVDRNRRNHTFDNLTPGVTYGMQVRACNGNNDATDCSAWSVEVTHMVPGTSPPVITPGTVRNLRLEPGDGTLTARWDPVTTARQTRQVTLTFQVQHQLSSVSDWPHDDDLLAGAIVNNANYTIPQLTNGMEYGVRVRGLHDGFMPGGWSDIKKAIPGQLGVPTGLSVRPLPDRKIRLGWDFVSGAALYEVRKIVGSSEEWVATVIAPTVSLEIDLESDLAHETRVTYEVRAQDNNDLLNDSNPSNIHILDSPILRIVGGSERGLGLAEVYWPKVDDATSYTIHYRELPGDHTKVTWVPQSPYPYNDRDGPPWEEITLDASQGDPQKLMHPIGTLSRNRIYGIFLSYVEGSETYVSAREAYVWTPEQVSGNGKRIATYPLTRRLTGIRKTYEYRVCFNLFDDAILPSDVTAETIATFKSRWTALAEQALEQWQRATNDLVIMTRLLDDCANYTEAIRQINEKYDGETPPTKLLEALSFYSDIDAANKEANEVIVVNFRNPIIRKFIAQAVYSNITKEVGLSNCLFANGFTSNADPKIACAQPRGNFSVEGGPIDILISSYGYIPPSPVTAGVQFNTCLDPAMDRGDDYSELVHEAGHVIGIGGGSAVEGWNERHIRAHPTVSESVVSYKGEGLREDGSFVLPEIPTCGPYPLDVMVVYALYRT